MGASRIGRVLGVAVAAGCTWIPLDGPLGDTPPSDGPSTDQHGEFDLANARTLFVGEAPNDHSSITAGVSRDLTGDGVTDLVLGAWWWDSNADGSAYVVSGDSLGTVSLSNADAEVTGGDGVQLVGCSVAAGDLDGDLQDDLLIGAKDAAYVVRGPVAGVSTAQDAAFIRFERPAGPLGECFDVTFAGDIDADGDSDVLVAYHTGTGSAAHVVVADGSTPGAYDLDVATHRLEGPLEGLGDVVTPDLDGDGVQDIVVGDYRAGDLVGSAFVVEGPIDGVASFDDAVAELTGPAEMSLFWAHGGQRGRHGR